MVKFQQHGNFKNMNKLSERIMEFFHSGNLDRYGKMGVEALSEATPIDTGRCANSWDYEITRGRGWTNISWHNSDIENGANVAILLQYGHATKSGTYVQGIDYINPTMRPIFESLAEQAWKEVTK